MKEEWKEKLRDGLADYEETVPEGLWNDIERAMAESRPDMVKPIASGRVGRSAAKTLCLRIMAAAACVACGAGILLYVGSDRQDEPPAIASRTSSKKYLKAPSSAERQLASADGVSKSASSVAADGSFAPSASVSQEAAAAENLPTTDEPLPTSGEPLASAANAAAPVIASAAEEVEKSVVVVASERQYKSSSAVQRPSPSSPVVPSGNPHAPASVTGGEFSASLYAANMTAGSGSSADSRMVLASSAMFNSMLPSSIDNASAQPPKGYVSSSAADEKTTHHRQPLRFGLSLRYAISDRWGIQSGVAYSCLRSDMTTRSANSRYDTRQKVHFIGLPLAVDYSVWRSRWLNVYVVAGGMVEKSVKATAATTYTIGDIDMPEETTDLKMRKLQWSANAAAGIQLNIMKSVGIYAEPGVGYYFDNGSPIKTAYTDKPFNFSVKLGLRYSFEK